ncbi:hypothetical protein [Mesorhizobium sp. B1-1-7]|uniref:hypothetical protein n=1 Tax=Mesorhizobium sp. B1-1-7 TaxID=2589977 RepID=UPI00112D3866|nr:hypothetical protein [Mesorhizobium sp. B1-1-7]TPN48568.1 hypothetical protein FJ978_19540 [Mesorhizobium sp. B1-1-7]
MTPTAVRKTIKTLIERHCPAVMVSESGEVLNVYGTPGDDETAVMITFAQTGPAIRKLRAYAEKKQPIRKPIISNSRKTPK